MTTRRQMLALMGTAAAAPLVYGCQGVATSTPQWITDVGLVVQGLASLVPSLASFGLSASTVAQVQQWVARAQQIASLLAGGITGASAAQLLQEFAALVPQILQVLSIALPPWAGLVISAAETLLPIILQAAGVQTRLRLAAPAMTPEEARRILAGAK